jgi:hypothetical protein
MQLPQSYRVVVATARVDPQSVEVPCLAVMSSLISDTQIANENTKHGIFVSSQELDETPIGKGDGGTDTDTVFAFVFEVFHYAFAISH